VNGEKTILNLVPPACSIRPHLHARTRRGDRPEVLVGEIEALRKRGYLAEDRWLRISEQAHLIMPYHRAIDRARERLRGAGTSGRRGAASVRLRGQDGAHRHPRRRPVRRDRLPRGLERNLREKNAYLEALLGEAPLAFDAIHERYAALRERLRPFVTDTVSSCGRRSRRAACCSRGRRA